MKSSIRIALVFILSLLAFNPARASHMVGGVMTYVYLGDSSSGGVTYQKYQVSLSIYEDCLNGDPVAIAQDNPAFLGVFEMGTNVLYEMDTNIYYSSSITIPAIYANACGESISSLSLCTLQKTFTQRYAFPPSAHGYLIAYQRCCRNAGIVNIVDPGNVGSTFFCTIPPTAITNNSAVFKNEPPQVACLNGPFYFDNSATDADGDSLSYGFCAGINGAEDAINAKPIPVPPPYDSIPYVPSYSSQIPLTGSPNLAIDPVTGIITGIPNLIGRYQIGVYCNEWRAGVLINTVRREFEVIILPCNLSLFTPVAGPDTIIIAGTNVNFYASAAVSYLWSPATFLSSTTISNPVGTFTEPGNYTYIVDEVNDSGCHGNDTLHIQVLDYSDFIVPSAFSPNGDNLNDYLAPLSVLNSTLISFKVFNRNGNLIYNGCPNELGLGWDGTYKGVKQEIGTYYWELLYNDSNGITRHMKGNVTLVR